MAAFCAQHSLPISVKGALWSQLSGFLSRMNLSGPGCSCVPLHCGEALWTPHCGVLSTQSTTVWRGLVVVGRLCTHVAALHGPPHATGNLGRLNKEIRACVCGQTSWERQGSGGVHAERPRRPPRLAKRIQTAPLQRVNKETSPWDEGQSPVHLTHASGHTCGKQGCKGMVMALRVPAIRTRGHAVEALHASSLQNARSTTLGAVLWPVGSCLRGERRCCRRRHVLPLSEQLPLPHCRLPSTPVLGSALCY